jgi:anthranilate synthase component II
LSKILLIDNYDSFTYNLVHYFQEIGLDVDVVRNDALPLSKIHFFQYDSIVLSPGPGRPCEAGIMMEIIDSFYDKIPFLGICLGHQALGEFFGAKLIHAQKPFHGKTSEIFFGEHPIFRGVITSTTVMRYHSLLLENLEETPLKLICSTKENEVMGFQHRDLPIVGLQFHPESILTVDGKKMLENWWEFLQMQKKTNII